MPPASRCSDPRKPAGFLFRVPERLAALLLGCALLPAAAMNPPYETAEGFLVLPEARPGMHAFALTLPPELHDSPLILVDTHGVRWPFTLLTLGEEKLVLYNARTRESFRLLYGFDPGEGGFVPVTPSTDERLLAGRVRVQPLKDQSMVEIRVLQGVKRPLARLGVMLAVGIFLFVALAVGYRKAIR